MTKKQFKNILFDFLNYFLLSINNRLNKLNN